MDVIDVELIRLLTERDGPLRDRSLPHDARGACRYGGLYPDGGCPWCAAVNRRREREAAAAAGPTEPS